MPCQTCDLPSGVGVLFGTTAGSRSRPPRCATRMVREVVSDMVILKFTVLDGFVACLPNPPVGDGGGTGDVLGSCCDTHEQQ